MAHFAGNGADGIVHAICSTACSARPRPPSSGAFAATTASPRSASSTAPARRPRSATKLEAFVHQVQEHHRTRKAATAARRRRAQVVHAAVALRRLISRPAAPAPASTIRSECVGGARADGPSASSKGAKTSCSSSGSACTFSCSSAFVMNTSSRRPSPTSRRMTSSPGAPERAPQLLHHGRQDVDQPLADPARLLELPDRAPLERGVGHRPGGAPGGRASVEHAVPQPQHVHAVLVAERQRRSGPTCPPR